MLGRLQLFVTCFQPHLLISIYISLPLPTLALRNMQSTSTMLSDIIYQFHTWLRPTIVAIFYRDISWSLRWRLLAFQPIGFLTYSIATIPCLLFRSYTVEYLPIAPDRSVRALIFKAAGVGKGRALRPLHVNFHAGGFMGDS